MRKALIATVVATALFAVGAFAASFTVQSEDIASGGNAVEACVTNVDIDFANPVADASGVWSVASATVNFLAGATPAADNPCNGFDARLALGLGTTAELATTSVYPGAATYVTVANGAATFSFAPAIAVESIQRASVVVDGMTLTADVTP